MENLFDVGFAWHVARMSLSNERLHFERSSLVEQVTYRFFMIQRKISMMSYQIWCAGNFSSFLKKCYTLLYSTFFYYLVLLIKGEKRPESNGPGITGKIGEAC